MDLNKLILSLSIALLLYSVLRLFLHYANKSYKDNQSRLKKRGNWIERLEEQQGTK